MTTLNQPCGEIIDFFGTWIFEPTSDIRLEDSTAIYSISDQTKIGIISKSFGLWKFEPVKGCQLKDRTNVYIIN